MRVLIFSVVLACTNCWTDSRAVGDFRYHDDHASVTIKLESWQVLCWWIHRNTHNITYTSKEGIQFQIQSCILGPQSQKKFRFMLIEKNFLIWLLICKRLHCQRIRRHVWKCLLTDLDVFWLDYLHVVSVHLMTWFVSHYLMGDSTHW